MKSYRFEIRFSDLNEAAQNELLSALGIDDPSEMNWDVYPLAEVDFDWDE